MVTLATSRRRWQKQASGQVRRSATAEIVCAQRAAETLRPPSLRLIDDPYARHFLKNLSVTELAQLYSPAHGFPYSTDDFFGVITGRRAGR
jgi:O-methyltransferase involved in polyketide biosynthesis